MSSKLRALAEKLRKDGKEEEADEILEEIKSHVMFRGKPKKNQEADLDEEDDEENPLGGLSKKEEGIFEAMLDDRISQRSVKSREVD